MKIKLIVAVLIGTFLQYFDYTLFGFFSGAISTYFFPAQDHKIALMMTWATFATGYLIRPLGAYLFGHYGDRLGRRKILGFSILLMSLPTMLTGLLPTFAQIGLFSPLLLILCRLIQGLAVSAEYNGSSIYLVESSEKHKGLIASMITCACGLGIFAAASTAALFTSLTVKLGVNSWRLPFVLAGVIVGIAGYYLRRQLPETKEFEIISNRSLIAKKPLVDAIKQNKWSLFVSFLFSAYVGSATYIIMVYMASYLQNTINLNLYLALKLTAIAGLVEALCAPIFGYMADRYKIQNILAYAALAMFLLAVPLFFMINSGNLNYLIAALLLLSILLSSFDGVLVSYLPYLFKVQYRYSAVAVSFNLGGAVIGGLTPVLMQFLLNYTELSIIPGIYLSILALFCFVTLTLRSGYCGENYERRCII